MGILPLTGLVIRDTLSNKEMNFKKSICSISVRQFNPDKFDAKEFLLSDRNISEYVPSSSLN